MHKLLGPGVLVLLLVIAPRAVAQDRAIPFSCESGAVSIDISRDPGARFVEVDRPPEPYVAPREFTFASGPIRRVRLYLSAILPEIHVGPFSEARLSVIAETWASPDPSSPSRWWDLVPLSDAFRFEKSSERLLFDANAVRGCFGGDTCRFAEVTAVAGDATALLVLGFGRNLGGANASGWEHARLVLDFRAAEPRVAVAADCAYNEGGGACTAHDSANAPRSDIACPWDAAAGDFACTERSDQLGRRDFQLLSGHQGPARAGDVATLEEAAQRLAGGAPGPVVVTGQSPVNLIREIALRGKRLLLFASGGHFYLARRTPTGVAALAQVSPHGLAHDPQRDSYASEVAPGASWTREDAPVFRADEIARRGSLVVLRIAEGPTSDRATAYFHTLYWLGIDVDGGEVRADALTLVTAGSYYHCAMNDIPTVVTAIGSIARPFDAPVTLQPPTVTHLDGEVNWRGAESGDEVRQCRRRGRIRWRKGEFDVDVDEQECRTADSPVSVGVAPDGSIRTSTAGQAR